MITLFLVCFFVGLILSLLSVFTGTGRLHIGHLRLGNVPSHSGHAHPGHAHAGHAHAGHGLSFLNGFTLPAFFCWFGGIGYLLFRFSSILTPLVLLIAGLAGIVIAAIFYTILARFVLPAERVLTAEDTRMDGVVARVSGAIRADDGIGEILFTQTGARRSAAARSVTGLSIPRGTEVVVLRYDRGIAYVSPLAELAPNLHS